LRQTIGCAALISIVPLSIGAIVALFMTEAPLVGRITAVVMPTAITFVAVLVLTSFDNARHRRRIESVRRMLLSRSGVDDDTFCSSFPDSDLKMLRLTRDGIARFFDVPPTCIHPNDQLDPDLQFASLEPMFHTYVTFYVLAECGAIHAPFTFYSDRVSDVLTLSQEISRILKHLPNVSDAQPDDSG
jgi:hypothetical protein